MSEFNDQKNVELENSNDENKTVDEVKESSNIQSETIKLLESQINSIKTNNEKLKKDYNEIKSRYVRSLADFDNLKKRTKKEVEDIKIYGITKLLKDFLPILDNLERALEHSKQSKDVEALVSGVELVQRQFFSTFENYSVKPFQSQGEIFNPNKHEALQMIENDEVPPNTVVIEYEKGYTIGERLLRPAKVIVAKNSNKAKKEIKNEKKDVKLEEDQINSKLDGDSSINIEA